jgi:MinD superfamily P-loop ATPase
MAALNPPVKQLVVLSGKGGTGKTSVTAALMHLANQTNTTCVMVDADVDAANLSIVTNAKPQETHNFFGGKLAIIDPEICSGCGKCFQICRFNAIRKSNTHTTCYEIVDLLCDGCAACVHICPDSAIKMDQQQDGEWYHSLSQYGHLFHAELFPGADNSGKLVTTIKQHAKLFAEDHSLPLIIVDGPPGIGCPVISASAGANLALIVAEPGASGLHDLLRIVNTLKHFKIPTSIIINKADLFPEGTKAIYDLADRLYLPIIGEIPFDSDFSRAIVHAQPITQYSRKSNASMTIKAIWETLKQQLLHEERIL